MIALHRCLKASNLYLHPGSPDVFFAELFVSYLTPAIVAGGIRWNWVQTLKYRFIGYFKPECRIHLPISNMENMNTTDELHHTLSIIDTNIKKIAKYTPVARIDGD